MNKKYLYVLLVAIGFAGLFILIANYGVSLDKNSEIKRAENDNQNESVTVGNDPNSETFSDRSEERETVEAFLQDQFLLDLPTKFSKDMNDSDVQDMIHFMSHQKVSAPKKWGKLQLTKGRVDKLLEIVQQGDFKHKHTYENILKQWSEGNFGRSVQAHNDIWKLQGGTVGRATGLLSPKEEKKFIERNF